MNSVISNSPLLRGNTEQVTVARSYAANPDRVQEVPQAPYVSPYVHVDLQYNEAVLQLRNGESGDVETQIPSEKRLAQIRQFEEQRQLQQFAQAEAGNAEILPQEIQQTREAPRSSDAPKVETGVPAQASTAQLAAFEAGAQTAQPSESGTVSITA
ncbi:MAG: hypothetical protein EOM26_11110 [Alphaproteobacteria bacterium]|nr:hypothetical protein [Alphaproteobacteria bacterium]